MSTDLFDQLAELDVPPAPAEFEHKLHDRLNQSLTTQQVIDLGMNAFPAAAMEFLGAVLGMLSLTITGKFPEKDGK